MRQSTHQPTIGTAIGATSNPPNAPAAAYTPPCPANRTNAMSAIRAVLKTLILLLFAAVPVAAQTYTVAPSPFLTILDNSGKIINGGCVWQYVAGTTTSATTYADAAGTPNTNPIKADSAGRFSMYLVPGQSYKLVYENTPCTVSPPVHGPTLRTADNISAMPASGVNLDVTGTAGETIAAGAPVYLSDGSGSKNTGQWYNADATNAYSSSSAVATGIAVSAIASGSSGSIRLAGRSTGLTGLTAGVRYYAASSAGTLTATEPPNSRFIGAADSTTSLIVEANPAVTAAPLNIAEGRLTCTTGTPVTTADCNGVTSIFYAPYKGSRIELYDGTRWNVRVFTEITISVAACTASKPYDVFLYDNAGTPTAELLVWTDATTRATALTTQNGVLVKTGATTRRYVGSFYCNASGGQTDDSLAKRYVWNYYNRVVRPLRVLDASASWSYTTNTWRQARGAGANQLDVMIGVAEVTVESTVLAAANNDNAGVFVAVGIGYDSTTGPTAGVLYSYATVPATNYQVVMTSHVTHAPDVGRHFYAWLEKSVATGTTLWFGTAAGGQTSQSGITGFLSGG